MTQIEFLGDLGRELDSAAGRLIRGRRRSARPVLALAGALVAAAVVVVLALRAAPPDPEREAAPAPPADVRDLLGVLRRPETAADHGPATEAARNTLGPFVAGPDPTYRVVATTSQDRAVVVLAPGAMPATQERPHREPGACLLYPEPNGDGGSVGCWTPAEIQAGAAHGTLGGHLSGLVPDGVTEVALTFVTDERRAPVTDNYYELKTRSPHDLVLVTMLGEDGKTVGIDAMGEAVVPVVAVPEETLQKADALAEAPDVEQPGRRLGTVEEVEAAAAEIARTVPYPPGFTEDYDWATTEKGDMSPAGTTAEVQALIEFRAQCMWQRYWLAAVQTEADAKITAQTLAVLATMSRWPTLRDFAEMHDRLAFAARQPIPGVVAREVALNCGSVAPGPRPR